MLVSSRIAVRESLQTQRSRWESEQSTETEHAPHMATPLHSRNASISSAIVYTHTMVVLHWSQSTPRLCFMPSVSCPHIACFPRYHFVDFIYKQMYLSTASACQGNILHRNTCIRTHWCWPTSKNLLSSALCGNWMPSRESTKSDGQLRHMARGSQKNLFYWHALMRMMDIFYIFSLFIRFLHPLTLRMWKANWYAAMFYAWNQISMSP